MTTIPTLPHEEWRTAELIAKGNTLLFDQYLVSFQGRVYSMHTGKVLQLNAPNNDY